MKADMEKRKQKNVQANQGASNNIFESLKEQPRPKKRNLPMIDFDEQDAYIKKM